MNARKGLFGIHSAGSGRYKLDGELSFASVDLALKKTAKIFVSPARIVFDLAGITKADSAGLALMLEWLRLAKSAGAEMNYVHLPRQLLNMAHVVGVDKILVID